MSAARAHVRLLRIALAPTTLADVWAGWFGSGQPFQPRLLLIHLAALALYFAGMTLNDVFDAARDREIHPDRPIPGGAVSLRAAAAQGAVLLGIGLGLATLAGRAFPGALLAVAILAYDGLFKRWAIPGALVMGGCRYLDVQLGAGFAAGPLFPPAVALGIYVALLTLVSRLEDAPGRDPARMQRLTRALLLGIFAVDAASLLALGHPAIAGAALALALTFRPLARLTSPPRPAKIRTT